MTFELGNVRGINRILRHLVTCLSCSVRKYVINMTGVRKVKSSMRRVARVWDQYSSQLYQGIDKIPS